MEDEVETSIEQINEDDGNIAENQPDQDVAEKLDEGEDGIGNKWWENDSQYLLNSQDLLNSQQLVEGLSICDEFLQSQSPGRDENGGSVQGQKGKALLSDYARLGPEDLKRDLEECRNMALSPAEIDPDLKKELAECQNVSLDPANIDLDTPPDFRLSQLVSTPPFSNHSFESDHFMFRNSTFHEFLQEFESQDSYIAWGGSVRGGKVVD